MTSIDRTAYPRFGRVVSARELAEVFTPTDAEVEWARGRGLSNAGRGRSAVRWSTEETAGTCRPSMVDVNLFDPADQFGDDAESRLDQQLPVSPCVPWRPADAGVADVPRQVRRD